MGICRNGFIAGFLISGCVLLPAAAIADTLTIHKTLESEGYQPFAALKQNAESLAQATVEAAFQDNPALTEVIVTVLGDRNGQIAPVLVARITRTQWQEAAQVSRWARYIDNSERLLGFLAPPPATSVAPSSATATATSGGLPPVVNSPTVLNVPPASVAPSATSTRNSPLGRRRVLENDPGYRDD